MRKAKKCPCCKEKFNSLKRGASMKYCHKPECKLEYEASRRDKRREFSL